MVDKCFNGLMRNKEKRYFIGIGKCKECYVS